jgi:hypothetical protein
LIESGQTSGDRLLIDPHITLYSLDFDRQRAIFVETPPSLDLSQAPFIYLAQYENAIRVFTIPFATLIELAQTITIDPTRLILIYSVGRAGSTLTSQILAQVPGVVNISEPDALSWLVAARHSQSNQAISLLCNACVRWLCKTPAQTAWVIKGRSFIIYLADWLDQFYPSAKIFFLYRNAETWLESSLRAFVSDQLSDQELTARAGAVRQSMAALVPLIARYDQNVDLSFTGVLALMWLSVMERYLELHQMEITMLAIRYADWLSFPQATAKCVLDYCNLHVQDFGSIENILAKDSQANTYLAQAITKQNQRQIRATQLEELNWHLQNHPIIQTPDFEVPNTLHL